MERENHWTAPWITVVATLAAVATVLAVRAKVLPVQWWALPALAAFGVAAVTLITLFQHTESGGGTSGWARVYAYRLLTCASVGGWVAWAARVGWHQPVTLSLLGGALLLAALSLLCRAPQPVQADPRVEAEPGRRPTVVAEWERRIRGVTRQPVRVTAVEPWADPRDGCRVHVDLVAESGMTIADLAGVTDRLAAAARLPQGCNIRAIEGVHQGTACLDVMLRDCLTDYVQVEEDTSPVSVNDEFTVMTSPRGERLNICLRIASMVVGGTVGSGKTTLLHRLIMWLARCVDALIWIVDLNGGGVAEPWIRPWACREADRPIVDWIADDEAEAAALVTVANAIIKDRKNSPQSAARKRTANTTVLPVGRDLPAIIVITDEGGEVRQAVSVLGQLAGMGITRLAQIGRAEAGRVIMSVLRGTSDLTDKGLRVTAGLRLCLRMEEEDEYSHVLRSNPGKTRLLHTGSAYLQRPMDAKPIFGRTVDVPLDVMERHAIACAPLRPDLDARGRKVAAKIRPEDIMGGRAVPDEIIALRVMQDAEAGDVYEKRWDRYAAKLAEMRGEDVDELDDEPVVQERTPTVARSAPTDAAPAASGGTGALDTWAAQVLGPPKANLEQPRLRLVENETPDIARERILAMVTEAGVDGISAADVERRAGVTRSRVYALLKELRDQESVVQNEKGLYVTPDNVEAA